MNRALRVIGLFLSLALAGPLCEQARGQTRIVFLGTGTPNPNPERSGPATAIVVDGTPYLVDFGPGVVRRAAAAGIAPESLEYAFATHLHSDHTVGLPDLIFSAWTLGRATPLKLYGPPGIKAMANHVVEAWQEDIDIRIKGLEPANETGYRVEVHESMPGTVYRNDRLTVKAFPVDHGSWRNAFGYRFETADRIVVISGDTTYSPSLIRNARGADVLIHEVYYTEGLNRRRPEWARYHTAFHTSAMDVGRIAAAVRPGLLVLYHVLFMGATEEQMLAEVREHYDGPVVIAKDLESY